MLSEKWRIRLLSGLEVTGSGKCIDRFRGRTSVELLALLAINSHRFVPREEIAGTIWPESSPEAGRAGLRTALASLRSQLEPPGTVANSVLLADRTAVRLSPDSFTSDIGDFNAYSARAASAHASNDRLHAAIQAVELYTGDLLPGNYSEWVLAEREKLHQIFQHHLTNIVTLYRSCTQPSLAIPYSYRLIEENSYDEDPYILTMRVCIEAGQGENALRTFEQLSKTMQAEYGTKPSSVALELERVARNICDDLRPSTAARSAHVAAAPDPIMGANSLHSHDNPTTVAVAMTPAQTVGLPVPLTRFFGRDTEIMHLEGLICPEFSGGATNSTPQRLITLTGTGGAGKTRLATETGRILSMQKQMPVTFVPLAEVTDPDRVLNAIADALKLVVRDTGKMMDQIVTALSGKPRLLILDNVEQLLAPGVPAESEFKLTHPEGTLDGIAVSTIASLLEYAPQLCCLVTSRQSLGIEGEQEYPLQPLATPALPATPARLLDFASVKLFVDRAQLSRPEFQLTTRNADIVGTICTQLDGLPLALELAAAWSSSLSPGQILERLAQRFELLVGRKRGRAARHASLRAALEWSFNLLTCEQQQFFCRLSVFRGGWTVQAAEHVCDDPHALETLAALRDRSLIVMDEAPDFGEDLLRYRLLESLRQYSAEQLSVEDTTAAKRRHLEWYAQWTNEAKLSWSGTQQQSWLQRVQIEQENIQAALEFSLNDTAITSAGMGMRIMGNLGQFWSLRGNYTEARKMFARFLAHPGTQDQNSERANALMNAGSLASFQEDWGAARELHEESLSITRICEPLRVGSVLLSLGNVSFASGEIASAKRYYQEGLTSYEAAGSIAGVASALGALGLIEMTDGHYTAAIVSVQKAVELNRGQANLSGVTHHLKQLALCYASAGQSAPARACFAESLAGYRALKDLRGMAELFSDCADVFPITEESVCLLAAAHTVNVAVSAMPKVNEQLIVRCRAALGDKVFDEAWKAGRELSTDQASGVAESVLKREVCLVLAGTLNRPVS